jgi:hypothetical protein
MPYHWLVTAVRLDTFIFIITGATAGRRDWAGTQGMRGKQGSSMRQGERWRWRAGSLAETSERESRIGNELFYRASKLDCYPSYILLANFR